MAMLKEEQEVLILNRQETMWRVNDMLSEVVVLTRKLVKSTKTVCGPFLHYIYISLNNKKSKESMKFDNFVCRCPRHSYTPPEPIR